MHGMYNALVMENVFWHNLGAHLDLFINRYSNL